MAVLLERVPVDRINSRAVEIRPGLVLLSVVGGLLYALGWLAAKTFTLLLTAAVWSAAAVEVGWQDARRSSGKRKARRR